MEANTQKGRTTAITNRDSRPRTHVTAGKDGSRATSTTSSRTVRQPSSPIYATSLDVRDVKDAVRIVDRSPRRMAQSKDGRERLHGIEKVRHEDNLTQLQRGQYTGTVTSQMCKDLASRIDSTGLNVDLSKLPVACAGKHAEVVVSEHIKMKRRNTIQRDASPRFDQGRAPRAPRPRVSVSDEEPP